MNPKNNASGGAILSVRAYPIDPATEILVGQVVKLDGGKVVPAAADESGAILGIANESHMGVEDALNIRANGDEILVADGPDMIYACPAPVVTATGGSTTTVVTTGLGEFTAADLTGGHIQLTKLAAGSTNVDGVGTAKTIENFSGGTFTVPEGMGAAANGDQFAIYPPIGFAKGNLTETGLSLAETDALSLKVVGHDLGTKQIFLMAKKHVLGQGE